MTGQNNYRRCISFPNGYTLSIVCNLISYGNARGLFEAALLNRDDEIIYDESLGFGDVRGYLEFEDVVKLIDEVSKFKQKEV